MPPTPSPTYERLRDTIARRMRMSHIDQPLMLMELLGRRSPAPAQDVARRILGEDATQIDYYTELFKRMVGKVLTGNGITLYDQGAYGLVGGVAEGFCAAVELSDTDRDQLLELCRQRLHAFRMQRGEEVGCLLTQKPAASGTGAATAPRSAARSKSGCSPGPRAAANAAAQAVAWQTPHQRALEVDHIVPRNHGGSDDLSNLQALCFRCNAAKRDGCLPTQKDAQTSAVCRPATPAANRAVCSARWRAAAGCCWRTNWCCASPMPTR
jgi:ATP adenylyltransferase